MKNGDKDCGRAGELSEVGNIMTGNMASGPGKKPARHKKSLIGEPSVAQQSTFSISCRFNIANSV